MGVNTDQIRQELQRLWSSNFLNIAQATQGALGQFRRRLHLGLELEGIVLDQTGHFQPHAEECLRHLGHHHAQVGIIIVTGVADEIATSLIHRHLTPLGVAVAGINDNPLHDDIAWNPRRPHLDILFDPLTQFTPARGDWFWADRLLAIAVELLAAPTMDTATNIICKSDQYAVRPVHTSSVFRKPLL